MVAVVQVVQLKGNWRIKNKHSNILHLPAGRQGIQECFSKKKALTCVRAFNVVNPSYFSVR